MTSNKQPATLANQTPETWSSEDIYNKALAYCERMHNQDANSNEQILYSCITLELLLRSALARLSPMLLVEASNNKWSHIYAALGYAPNEPKYLPKSITVTEVIKRLGKIFSDFTQEQQEFCFVHLERRNSEFHSGENSFSQIKEGSWLPRFYQTIKTILSTMDKEFSEFLDDSDITTAEKLIEVLNDQASNSAKEIVVAYKKVWENKDKIQKNEAQYRSKLWAKKQDGHITTCPSCGSECLVVGEQESSPKRKMDDDKVIEKYESLPTHLECIACDLKISGLSKLSAIGLGERFLSTKTYDFAEFYELQDIHSEYEPDYNDPIFN